MSNRPKIRDELPVILFTDSASVAMADDGPTNDSHTLASAVCTPNATPTTNPSTYPDAPLILSVASTFHVSPTCMGNRRSSEKFCVPVGVSAAGTMYG